jgi:hypothetical protein
MKFVLFLIVLLLSLMTGNSFAQDGQSVSPQLSKVDKALECLGSKSSSGWKRERVQPIIKGENVLVDVWSFCDRRVKVSILPHVSQAEAVKAIQGFASTTKSKKVLGIGDDAYVWGFGNQIAMRKGSFTVYVGAVSSLDTMLPFLESEEKSALLLAELSALNKSFAKQVAFVLDDVSAVCGYTNLY